VREIFRTFRFSRFLHVSFFKSSTFRFAGLIYKLDHAPLCRKCDAYQCKRCIWLNRKTTLEVNTPSHEQCVVAHLERNASRNLLTNIRKYGAFLADKEIKGIDYLDPFNKLK
jgi:CXXX repeat peptide maturase